MAATGISTESATFPSSSFVENLFTDFPTDARFSQVVTQKVVPVSALDSGSKKIEFVLPRLQSPNVYFISKVMLECTVVITKKDGTLPTLGNSVLVAPVNNMLSSLFESVSIKINDKRITASSSYYPYKCYLQNLLSYDIGQKMGFLNQQGYQQDAPAFSYEPTLSNAGWKVRSDYFRINREAASQLRSEGATFIGRLSTILKSWLCFLF